MLRFGICYPDNKNFKYVKEKRRETLAEKLQPLTVLAFYSIIVVKSHLKRQADQHLSSSLAITCMWFTACILTFPKQKMKHYLLRILKLLNENMSKSLKLIALLKSTRQENIKQLLHLPFVLNVFHILWIGKWISGRQYKLSFCSKMVSGRLVISSIMSNLV